MAQAVFWNFVIGGEMTLRFLLFCKTFEWTRSYWFNSINWLQTSLPLILIDRVSSFSRLIPKVISVRAYAMMDYLWFDELIFEMSKPKLRRNLQLCLNRMVANIPNRWSFSDGELPVSMVSDSTSKRADFERSSNSSMSQIFIGIMNK